MRPIILISFLSLVACGPTQEIVDAVLFAPQHGVRTHVYAENTADQYHLVVQDTRGGAAAGYVADARMDEMARSYCEKRRSQMQIVSRGKTYMRDDITTDLWFHCAPVTPTVSGDLIAPRDAH